MSCVWLHSHTTVMLCCIPLHHFSLGHQTGYAHNVALLTETSVSHADRPFLTLGHVLEYIHTYYIRTLYVHTMYPILKQKLYNFSKYTLRPGKLDLLFLISHLPVLHAGRQSLFITSK